MEGFVGEAEGGVEEEGCRGHAGEGGPIIMCFVVCFYQQYLGVTSDACAEVGGIYNVPFLSPPHSTSSMLVVSPPPN